MPFLENSGSELPPTMRGASPAADEGVLSSDAAPPADADADAVLANDSRSAADASQTVKTSREVGDRSQYLSGNVSH